MVETLINALCMGDNMNRMSSQWVMDVMHVLGERMREQPQYNEHLDEKK